MLLSFFWGTCLLLVSGLILQDAYFQGPEFSPETSQSAAGLSAVILAPVLTPWSYLTPSSYAILVLLLGNSWLLVQAQPKLVSLGYCGVNSLVLKT